MPVSARSTPFAAFWVVFSAASRVRFATSICVRSALRLGELGRGQVPLRLGRVPGPRHLLGAPQGHGLYLVEVGVPRVFLLRQDQVGLGGFEPGLGLLDPLLDLVFGELQCLSCSGLVRLGGREAAAGDLDLNGDLQPEPGEGRLLPAQFRLGAVSTLLRAMFDLVPVGHRVDLRQHLALLDPVVLLDQEADEVPRHRLRRDVDDVGLHEGVVGDRVGQAVGPPGVDNEDRQHGQGQQPARAKQASREQTPARGACGRRGRLWWRRGRVLRPGSAWTWMLSGAKVQSRVVFRLPALRSRRGASLRL